MIQTAAELLEQINNLASHRGEPFKVLIVDLLSSNFLPSPHLYSVLYSSSPPLLLSPSLLPFPLKSSLLFA